MPRAFITGVTGQDGHYLSRDLNARGYDVHGTVRTGAGDADPGITLHPCDLRDSAELRRLVIGLHPDEIYNLGGQSSVAASWRDPVETLASSATPVAVLLEAAWQLHERGRAPRVVQASSAEIFGEVCESPQSEATPIAPVSPYGAAKALGHHLIGVYRLRGLHASSVILYNHESPQRPETFVTRKITRAVARISRGLDEALTLGTLDVRRDWGWAPDYANAMRLAAAQEKGGDYVIGSGEAHTVAEFVEEAFAAVGIADWKQYVSLDPSLVRPVDPSQQRADSSKARHVLGWAPTVTFSEMVQRMVEADLALLP